jgi:hypothetical protein
MRKHNQFGKRGTFECETCGGRTRECGQENTSICFECYEIAGYENSIQDAHMSVDEVKKVIAPMIAKMEKRNGYSEAKFHENFSIIFG